ncbi:MAG: hypothetical protein DWQ36_16670 [Acidobacteria bacterium]|nr:MAG: hypothetical protein DWQ30_14840 [Acidobacteriota bacterium]REK04487.1 MAG: hypothetical protein DWQ36_16670 [Acidobacteriota bacterium]
MAWIEQWASDFDLPVSVVERDQMERYFGVSGRYEIARRVAALFEELRLHLPDKRRRWESERPMLGAFVAIGRGLASYRGG